MNAMTRNIAALLLCAASAMSCGSSDDQRPHLDVATTTSVQNSGLLDVLIAAYQPTAIRVHAVGSRLSLGMLSDGTVDLAISHAPQAEAEHLAKHHDWLYRKFAYNRFIVVGPGNDPAGVRHATDVLDAFRRIANSGAAFVSRGDGSGTHEREQSLWQAAGVKPSPDRLLVSGKGMALALRHSDERQAYTLSDEATFWQFSTSLMLVSLFEGDERLLNTYAVIYPRDAETAAAFAEWLTGGEGRELVGQFKIARRQTFTVWPSGCPADSPERLPCAEAVAQPK